MPARQHLSDIVPELITAALAEILELECTNVTFLEISRKSLNKIFLKRYKILSSGYGQLP